MINKKKESIKLDKSKNKIVITKEEEVGLEGENLKDIEERLVKELEGIVWDVKAKKRRAIEIKEILAKIRASKQ